MQLNPSFIRALKMAIGDREDYENQIAYYKKMKWNCHNHMIVIPVSFNRAQGDVRPCQNDAREKLYSYQPYI
jgi:hypothetical protein